MSIFDFCAKYKELIEIVADLLADVIGFVTIVVTIIFARKQIRSIRDSAELENQRHKEALANERQIHKENLKTTEKMQRMLARPYLVLDRKCIDVVEELDNCYRIWLCFKNKGRGPAVDISMSLIAEGDSLRERIKLNRIGPIETPVVTEGESFETLWETEEKDIDFQAVFIIMYQDIYGEQYRQNFRINISKKSVVCVNYPTPELIVEDK